MARLVLPRALVSLRRLELRVDKLVEHLGDIALGIRFPLGTFFGHDPTVPFSAAYLSKRAAKCLDYYTYRDMKRRLAPVLLDKDAQG